MLRQARPWQRTVAELTVYSVSLSRLARFLQSNTFDPMSSTLDRWVPEIDSLCAVLGSLPPAQPLRLALSALRRPFFAAKTSVQQY